MRSHLAVGRSDQAIADMKILEQVSPSKAALTQLYFELGRSLKAEMDTLEKKGEVATLQRTREAYKQFLNALATSAAGQSYESLEWAGEAMLDLGIPQDAEAVLHRILDTYSKDPEFQKRPDAADRLLRTRIKLAAALREQGQFQEGPPGGPGAHRRARQSPRTPHRERASSSKPGPAPRTARAPGPPVTTTGRPWPSSSARCARKPIEYYDAWYHAAFALFNLGNKSEAIATLKGVLVLNPSLGSPEMKAKYNELLQRMNR